MPPAVLGHAEVGGRLIEREQGETADPTAYVLLLLLLLLLLLRSVIEREAE